ncbi:MAG: hypothetical protein C0514_00345 [Candidatus Puniceispirillum sp.]|nr:hypothetical protein [Candidatus Puniceispirillum sp.]
MTVNTSSNRAPNGATQQFVEQLNQQKTRIRFAVALVLSGFAALAYQVAWQRVLTQVIGSDAISMVLVVTIFMICLGIGSELAKFLVAQSQARALRLYATIEVLVAAYGIISIPLLRTINASTGAVTGDSLTADFLLNLGLLSLPIIGMGLTTPLIVHVAKESLSNVGRTVGLLYGWNIAGAAIGSLLTGLLLIELFGLRGTTLFAAGANVVAAAIAIKGLRLIPHTSQGTNATATGTKPAKIPTTAAISAVLFGFGTLAIQIIFFRVLSNYLTLSTIVFPVLLCAYLCLMSAGQWVGGQLADRYSERLPYVIAALFALGAVLLLAALAFPPEWAAYFNALRFSSFNGQLVAPEFAHLIGDPSPITVFLFSFGMMLSVMAWSGLFPVMFRLITQRIEDAGNRFARIYTLYTVGNVVGAFACGIFLLPYLGTGLSALATVLVVALGSLFVLLGNSSSSHGSRAYILLAAGAVAGLLMPTDYYRSFKFGKYEVAEVFEGRTGVATVVPTSRFYTIVDVNRTASASALNADPGPADLYEAWRWNHTDLMALDPSFRPKNILVIGIGHAYLIDAMLDLPFVEKITVVDISAEVVEAVKKYTKTSAKRIFTDPRVEIVIGDGRRFVQSAIKHGVHYDLIQNKINEPWHAGGGNLFTEEFFLEEKKLLTPGGYLSTRPLTGHLTDGLKVFHNAMWTGYYHMYFKNGEVTIADTAIVSPDIKDAWYTELAGKGPVLAHGRDTLQVAVFKEVPDALRTDPNTDDYPTFEYYWVRQLLGNWVSPRVSFQDLDFKPYFRDIPVKIQ